MTGTLEEHVTSYNKHAQRRITATDTRLSNGSIISKTKEERKKKQKKKKQQQQQYLCHFFVFFL